MLYMAPLSGPSAHPRLLRRPPPLLLLAAAALVSVIGGGVALILARSGDIESKPVAAKSPADIEGPTRDERPAAKARRPAAAAEPTARHPSPTSTPTPTPALDSTVEAQIAATGEIPPGTRPEHLPIWARPPRVTSQPFPEGARINPPLPPVKIPPEMLAPPAPGAGTGSPP
jgi:hypothetical protein